MSRIGSTPDHGPVRCGRRHQRERLHRRGEGPQGHPRATSCPSRSRCRNKTARSPSSVSDDERESKAPARPDPVADQQHGRLASPRASRRSSRSSASATAANAKGNDALELQLGFSPTRSTSRRPRASSSRSRSADPDHRESASTSSWSARWPPTSVPSRSLSRTRARAFVTRVSTGHAQGRKGREVNAPP